MGIFEPLAVLAIPIAGVILGCSAPAEYSTDSSGGAAGRGDASEAGGTSGAGGGGGTTDAKDGAATEGSPETGHAEGGQVGDGQEPNWTLSRAGFVLTVAPSGDIIDLHDDNGSVWMRAGGLDNLIRIGIDDGEFVKCDAPKTAVRQDAELTFDYDLRPRVPLLVHYAIGLVDAGDAVSVKRVVQVTPSDPPLPNDVKVAVGDNLAAPGADAGLFIPHHDGFGEQTTADGASGRRFLFALAGQGLDADGAERLAIPMISQADDAGHRLTRVADPWFSTSFALSPTSPASRIGWVYTGHVVPMTEGEGRVFWDVLHGGPPDAAMAAFYATAIADVPPGPAWLHEIAWQHYDYMSHGGRGWFDDIDAVAAAVPMEERARVLFTLHGWFDVYGRYAFDAASRRLVDDWTVFPNATAVAANFPGLETMPMSKSELHRRIAYAKTQGFRVALYFADGTATGEDVTGLWQPDRTLSKGGWQGPDTTSPTWVLNPAHPEVAAYFRDYLDALLMEYGNEIDALAWDETFTVRLGATGPAPNPSYADRGMMRLTHDLTRRVTAFRSELAFLTSDDIGLPGVGDIPPYALMGHGTYQDSWSYPDAWRYGLFPNLRNTLWSCNWHAQTNFEYTRIGVEQFNTPVATSNGYGDNLGIARLESTARDQLLALFATRKAAGRQELRWLQSR